MSKAIDGLAAPRPASDGTADPRPPKVRRGHALIEVLRRFLDLGFAPTHGGERPHVTVTMDLDARSAGNSAPRCWTTGGPITATQAIVAPAATRIHSPAFCRAPSRRRQCEGAPPVASPRIHSRTSVSTC